MRRFACLLILPLLAGCTQDLGAGSYAFVVHEKFNHLKCPELKGQIASFEANVKRLEGMQQKAGASGVGGLVGTATYGPEITESYGNLRILRQAYAAKNCDSAPKQ